MAQTLVERLAPRLKELERGGYSREHLGGKRRYRTSLHLAVAEILRTIEPQTRERVRVPGTRRVADFKTNGVYVFVDRDPAEGSKGLERAKAKVLMISRSPLRSDRLDPGIRVVEVGSEEGGRLQTIFLDDPSFNFDYAHILPHTQKCSVMHGHTSSVLVEIIGRPKDGMVVDFGIAKDAVREAVRSLDHKLFINERYVTQDDRKSVTLQFRTVHGEFKIQAPKGTTVLLDGEATVENLAREVLSQVSPKMPPNVTAVGVYVYEGLNKGSHLLARLHELGDDARRRKP